MTVSWYAGIGSRETPKEVLLQMREFAYQAALQGWGLRSGAAVGADTAFEHGAIDAVGAREIFLAWKNCGGHDSPLYNTLPLAAKLAESVHPAWHSLSRGAKSLVSRNMHQILGPNLDDPVQFVICYTRDGCESLEQYSIRTGGTGTAIGLASSLEIPVYNLRRPGRLKAAYQHIGMLMGKDDDEIVSLRDKITPDNLLDF